MSVPAADPPSSGRTPPGPALDPDLIGADRETILTGDEAVFPLGEAPLKRSHGLLTSINQGDRWMLISYRRARGFSCVIAGTVGFQIDG